MVACRLTSASVACRHTACTSPSCQLCSNNPHKACTPSQCLDQQYWVRDDARGGQVVKAKCGADVVVQLFQGSDPQPLQQAGVQVKVGGCAAPGNRVADSRHTRQAAVL
jgi:hypothetical protein